MTLRAPYPWPGGKRSVAQLIWAGIGDVPNYVEPFFGGGSILLLRPHEPRIETVNDIDCHVANFWRAVAADPEAVAAWADWPVNEADLHARHLWLTQQTSWREKLKSDPAHYDAKIAGWWVWGICQWIGSGWCAEPGWRGRTNAGRNARGIHAPEKKRPVLMRGERGVYQQLPDLGGSRGAAGRGVHSSGTWNQRPDLSSGGRGVSAKIPVLGGDNKGVHGRTAIVEWMLALAERFRRVRVCCGDWKRVLGPAATTCIGVTGVVLDPPYGHGAGRTRYLYNSDSLEISAEVREWALAHGSDPKLRIVLCGYEGEHQMPPEWQCVAWQANGGYGNRNGGAANVNRTRERLWFSPHCFPVVAKQVELFGRGAA